MNKTALIFGISGQDAAFLSLLLLRKGYRVIGTSRDPSSQTFWKLSKLGILPQIEILSLSLLDVDAIINILRLYKPHELYNLAGQTSVSLSFREPVISIDSIATATLNILEAIRLSDNSIRFYNAGSSECFGDTAASPACETTPFNPGSPYAVAKSSASWLVSTYRTSYQLFVCTGILFNHESHLRPDVFVTQKIVKAAALISLNRDSCLHLGNLNIYRDWGWSPEYVEAMWRMLQLSNPQDFVIATGETRSLKEFVALSFSYFDLDWQDHVRIDRSLLRPSDLSYSSANPLKAEQLLDWSATTKLEGLVHNMCSFSELA
jgi:GDPmannose 4,6-dehydratase